MDNSKKIRMAQYGTKHGHAAGVLSVMLANPDVEVVGLFEPDAARRLELKESGISPWSDVKWIDDKSEILQDDSIVAISSEGSNLESLDHSEEIVDSGKHVFYDKPAGDNYDRFKTLIETARTHNLLVQLGYMFRYHDGFSRISNWAKSGFLGDVFAIRGHMSTNIALERQDPTRSPSGGIFYDLASHMLDQVVWILGRPKKVTSFLREDIFQTHGFANNTLGVFEFDGSMAMLDIAAMEPTPTARRFEVFGSVGSVIMEPMEPANTLRLALTEPRESYPTGVSIISLEARPRYVASLNAFIQDVRGEKQPDRSLDHELLVQETLLRATGQIDGI